MAKKERFGKFVLLEEIDGSGLGTEYRAAKLSATGLEKIVTVLRVKPALSANTEAIKGLMDQVKVAAQLQNPNIVKILGIGKVDTTYYISYEFLEGKSLKAIFNRCRQEGFPFSVDHALLIASKVCSALEYAQGRKTDAGTRYLHGMVTPASIVVSYEGEVRLRGFGYWPARIREAGGLAEDEALYLAPEQAAGGAADTRSDIFAVGAILYETLTGEPLFKDGRAGDPAARVAGAKLQNPTGDDDSLPKPIADILQKSLAEDPAKRHAEVQEMRKAVDTLLFSGDFTPTTFNLAFFMHSLFRDDIERESKSLKEEKDSTYLEYLTEEPVKPAATRVGPTGFTLPGGPLPPVDASKTEPVNVREVGAAKPDEGSATIVSSHATTIPPSPTTIPPSPPVSREPHPPAREHAHPPHHEPAPFARDAGAGFTFHKEEPSKSKLPLFAGLAALLILGGVGLFWFLGRGGSGAGNEVASPVPSTLSAEAAAALAKVKELEDKLRLIEEEKAAAAAKAEEEAKKKVEAAAAARGQAVDPAALQRAQEEARRKAEAEQAKKQEEERKRLEEEQRAAEARLAEERRKAEEEAARAATTTLPATTQPPVPAVKPGSLVDINESGVIAPIAVSKGGLQYPPIAQRQRVEGTVELSVLVDEKGGVVDAKVTSAAGGKAGLNEAAIDYVKRWRFRPASKEGVPVRVWIPVSVRFVLPR